MEVKEKKIFEILKESFFGLSLSILIGLISFFATKFIFKTPLADPLIIALALGILIKTIIGKSERFTPGLNLAPSIFIPIGAILYGAINLKFLEFAKVNLSYWILLIGVIIVYFGVIFGLGKLLNQRDKITYLTIIGSGVCGASAIAISSKAIDAEPDDVSISLISIFLVASFGLFILFPFLSSLINLPPRNYALLSATTLQFTGFVKIATSKLPKDLIKLAISIKALRYLLLLIFIPLFASFVKRKPYIPWFLWAFLGAGLLFSFAPSISKILTPIFKPTLDILWAIAMAAIGLNADIRALLSDNGLKALFIAFLGFLAAIIFFLILSFLF